MITKTVSETKEVAKKLGSHINQKTIILLRGDLGAGKTSFTQGLAQGLGVARTVSSPTFTIMKVYQGRLPLYHIDAYRLEGINQDLGFEDQLDEKAVCVIEWPEYIEEILPEEHLEIRMNYLSENEREILFQAKGEYYRELIEGLV